MTSEDDDRFGRTAVYERCKQWIADNEDKSYLGHGSADRHEAMMERCTKIVQDHENGVR